MMEPIIYYILALVVGFATGQYTASRKKFVVNIDKEKGEATIEQENRPKKKVEFISEPTQSEAEEAEKPKGVGKFLKKFVKPAKEEEDEE